MAGLCKKWLIFDNIIYNLHTHKFIEPHYTQFISQSVNWKWSAYVSPNKICEMNNMFNKIFPDEQIKKAYLEVLATGLYGKSFQRFHVAKGGGGNGKSMLNMFVVSLLGDYGYILNNSVLS